MSKQDKKEETKHSGFGQDLKQRALRLAGKTVRQGTPIGATKDDLFESLVTLKQQDKKS